MFLPYDILCLLATIFNGAALIWADRKGIASAQEMLFLCLAGHLAGLVLLRVKTRAMRPMIKALGWGPLFARNYLRYAIILLPISIVGLMTGVQYAGIILIFWIIQHERRGLFPDWFGSPAADSAALQQKVQSILSLPYADLQGMVTERFLQEHAQDLERREVDALLESLDRKAASAGAKNYAQLIRGQVALYTGDLAAAHHLLNQLLDSSPPPVVVALAALYQNRVYLLQNRPAEAVAVLRRGLLQPRTGHIRLLVASALAAHLMAARALSEAKEILLASLKQWQFVVLKANLYHQLVHICLARGEAAQAVYWMKCAVGNRTPTTEFDLVIELILVYIETNRRSEAQRLLDFSRKKFKGAEQQLRLLYSQVLLTVDDDPAAAYEQLGRALQQPFHGAVDNASLLTGAVIAAFVLAKLHRSNEVRIAIERIAQRATTPFHNYYLMQACRISGWPEKAQEFRAQLLSSPVFSHYMIKAENQG